MYKHTATSLVFLFSETALLGKLASLKYSATPMVVILFFFV